MRSWQHVDGRSCAWKVIWLSWRSRQSNSMLAFLTSVANCLRPLQSSRISSTEGIPFFPYIRISASSFIHSHGLYGHTMLCLFCKNLLRCRPDAATTGKNQKLFITCPLIRISTGSFIHSQGFYGDTWLPWFCKNLCYWRNQASSLHCLDSNFHWQFSQGFYGGTWLCWFAKTYTN